MQGRLSEKAFRAGAALSRFVACDVCRDVEVVDASEAEGDFVVARRQDGVRTWNVLYASNPNIIFADCSGGGT